MPAALIVNVRLLYVALPCTPTRPTSRSCQGVRSGCVVTENSTALLLVILGATDTSRGPDVAPAGIVTMIEVLFQESIVKGRSFSVTWLPFCDTPKPLPVIVT